MIPGAAAIALLAGLLLAGQLPQPLFIYYCAISIAAFGLYGFDKSAAERGHRRIRARTLHALSLAGGWPGACWGQQVFRHKRQKPAFMLVHWLMGALHSAALGWWLIQPAMTP